MRTLTLFHHFIQVINPDVVSNKREVKKKLRSHRNAGATETKPKADLGNIKVWFNDSGIANILSLCKIVAYDHINRVFIINTKGIYCKDGKLIFKRGKEGFPYCDLTNRDDKIALVNTINTIRDHFEGLTGAK